ncbi:hypothetical protein C8A01DRAFT_45630 [Parachaetomium inaequale]|uniref:Uncharacterized protein n=1 Tax=Parachaetomium inaequale TaxID=2588326 RepID=A0AAN6PLP8_9PEZI|nr:hypothetical protein C8A01DRAFT_45630 [Parachaetomium inaequale]
MGASEAPFMYQAVSRDDERFPAQTFDPKAVTRASYEPKKPKPKPDGPLVSFNRHPDAHMVPNGRRSKYRPMGYRTKAWIKGMRVVQIGLRVIQLIAAGGLITVMSVAGLMGWVIGVTLGFVILHCGYSVFHHFRPAGARTPGSSAMYQLFSGVSDLCVLPLYAYGAILARNKGEEWKTATDIDPDTTKYMVPSVYYGLIGAGGLHLLSLAISLWLGLMFRRIANMPPDMNPLEANLTSRVTHKRNKSSVTTTSTYSDEKRESQLYDDSSRPPSIPFMHTRQGSETSFTSRDSRLNLPSRQYQVPASNRSSVTSQDLKRMSAPPPPLHRASYMEIPLGETGTTPSRPTSMHSSRPSSGSVPSYRAEPVSPAQTLAQPRSAKFTETWYASESLISRTQQRNRAPTSKPNQAAYASLDASDDDNDNDSGSENDTYYTPARGNTTTTTNDENTPPHHPNPLRSNPTTSDNTTTTPAKSTTAPPRRPRTPFSRLRNSVLSTISPNEQDITDQSQTQTLKVGGGGGGQFEPRNRLSSIQPDSAFFYSKPYGELKAATPPIMVGTESRERDSRVVSSGNDYDLGSGTMMGRRNVSGKVAEEGRAGQRWSRYGVLNE